jgi:hypothetical protein
VDGSEMVLTQMGTYNRSEMISVLGTPCELPLCITSSNGNSKGANDEYQAGKVVRGNGRYLAAYIL